MTMDIITVPTEVILWRIVPNNTRSKCLDVTARTYQPSISHGIVHEADCYIKIQEAILLRSQWNAPAMATLLQ